MTAILPHAPPPGQPQRAPVRASFVAGLAAPFRGMGFLLGRPKLWPLAAVPILLTLVLCAGFTSLAIICVPSALRNVLGPTSSWYETLGARIAVLLATATTIVLGLLVSLSLAQPLSGPAVDRLLRALSQELGSPSPAPLPWWKEAWMSIASASVGLAVAVPLLALLMLADLLIPAAALITVPLKLFVAGAMLVWNFMDYPFTMHGLGIRQRASWLASQKVASLGFAVSLAMLFLIPCMNILMLPAGAVGAAFILLESRSIPSNGITQER